MCNVKNICMVWEGVMPPSIRVEKEALALVRAGFTVYVLCWQEKDKPIEENYFGINICRVLPIGGGFWKLGQYCRLLFWFDPIIKSIISDFVKKKAISVLHIHNLPLLYTALQIRNKFGLLKIIADLHENYPAGLQEWMKSGKPSLKHFIIKKFNSYKRWTNYERWVLRKVDKIIVVVDEMQERIVKTHELKGNNINIIGNKESKDFVKKANYAEDVIAKYKDDFVISYIGGFGTHRGLDTVIEGMQYFSDNNLKLLLVGKGSGFLLGQYYDLLEKYNLQDRVEILGWQPFDKVMTYISISKICLIPHAINEHTDCTIPYKINQYMMVGKPMIVSDCRPLRRTVEKYNSGVVFHAGDAKDFSEKVKLLYNDKALRKQLGENGRKAVFSGDNWEEESKLLISLYENC